MWQYVIGSLTFRTVRLVLESKNMSARSEVLYWERYRHFIAPRVQYCLTYDPPGKTKPGRDNSVRRNINLHV